MVHDSTGPPRDAAPQVCPRASHRTRLDGLGPGLIQASQLLLKIQVAYPKPLQRERRHGTCRRLFETALTLSYHRITQDSNVVDLNLHDIAVLHVLWVAIGAHPEYIARV